MTLGERFVRAVAAKDRDELRQVLAGDVDFKGLTPRRFWEGASAEEVIEVLLGSWFEPEDVVEEVAAVEQGDDIEDVKRVGYRFRLVTPSGPHVVEQQAYYRESGDRMGYLRVVCSGFQPTSS
jgi:hypothetical protein